MAASSDWQDNSFFKRAKYVLVNRKEWADCSFVFGSGEKKEISAHKIFLAMSSPVFEAMFFGSLSENKFQIPVTDINPDDFELLLEYIYTENVAIGSLNEAMNVYKAAHKYIIPGLMRLCEDRIWNFVSAKTACSIYEFIQLNHYELADLEERCLKIISKYTEEILEDQSFLEIKSTTLESILEWDDLCVPSEMKLFEALLKWAESECQRKGGLCTLKSVLTTTLPKVRFLTLKPRDITEGVARTDVLTPMENYAILTNIVSPNSTNVAMPTNFSTSRIKRSGCALIQTNEKHSWIPRIHGFKTIPDKNGQFSITNILFSVSKKVKIVGLEVDSCKSIPTKMNKSDVVIGIEIAVDAGKPISTIYFHQMKFKTSSEIEFDESLYMERSNDYVLRVLLYHPQPRQLGTQSQATQYIPTTSSFSSTPVEFGSPNSFIFQSQQTGFQIPAAQGQSTNASFGGAFSSGTSSQISTNLFGHSSNTTLCGLSFAAPVSSSFPSKENKTGNTSPHLPESTPVASEKLRFVFQGEEAVILKICA